MCPKSEVQRKEMHDTRIQHDIYIILIYIYIIRRYHYYTLYTLFLLIACSECVLHIEPFFVPVDIQFTSVRADSSILERYKLYGHETTTQIHDAVLQQGE